MSLSGSPLAKLGSSLQGSNVQHPLYNLDRGTEKHTYSLYEFHKAERMQTKYPVELPKVAVAAVIDKTPKFQQLKTIEGYFSFLQGPMQYSEGTFPLVTQRPRYLLVTICWDCRYSFPLGRLGQRKGRGYWGRFERAMLRSGAAHFCPCIIGQNSAMWLHTESEVYTADVEGMGFGWIIANSASIIWKQKRDSKRANHL